ncbi:hypothetical protein Sste5346_006159 [Sporothrix stenoceras]|uniref:NAD-dependent epimerase/dehydratase domain-containing protein n=1 Tax=Sporothrix stenoceras TaxID=5173 RepID=A0ABR3Z149_9PEZI
MDHTLPKGSLVLVTGANGYIGSHIVDVLLSLKYRVRGTVRTIKNKTWLNDFFDSKYGPGVFETVEVPSLDDTTALDRVMTDVGGVVHVAADVSFSSDPHAVIPQAVETTLNVLRAAQKQESVSRFVLTSSSSAALVPKPNQRGIVVDQTTYNDAMVAAAWSDDTPEATRAYCVYAAAKTESERAAWAWSEKEKPGFVLNTVLPNTNWGRILIPDHQRGSSMRLVRNFWDGNHSALQLIPPQYFVNVGDCARLHVAALLNPSVHHERLFAYAAAFNWTNVIGVLKTLRPDYAGFPEPPPDEGRDYTIVAGQKRAETLLKTTFGQNGWTPLEQSLADGIEGLL